MPSFILQQESQNGEAMREKVSTPYDSIACRTILSSNKTWSHYFLYQFLRSLWRNFGPLFFATLFKEDVLTFSHDCMWQPSMHFTRAIIIPLFSKLTLIILPFPILLLSYVMLSYLYAILQTCLVFLKYTFQNSLYCTSK